MKVIATRKVAKRRKKKKSNLYSCILIDKAAGKEAVLFYTYAACDSKIGGLARRRLEFKPGEAGVKSAELE